MARGARSTGRGGSLLELVAIVVVAVVLALAIQAFLVKPFQIPSESMVPTLTVGQRVLVNRLGERFHEPEIGDVVVFHPPAGATDELADTSDGTRCGREPGDGEPCSRPTSGESAQNFIKRVVAGPGDTIAVVGGQAVLNGTRQREPYVQRTCEGGVDQDFPTAIEVPRGHWFVLGDNRQCSQDSRVWGPVPAASLIGGAFLTYWPPERVGGL